MDWREYYIRREGEVLKEEDRTTPDLISAVRELRQSLQTIKGLVDEEIDRVLEKMDLAIAAQGVSYQHPKNLGFENWGLSDRAHKSRMGEEP